MDTKAGNFLASWTIVTFLTSVNRLDVCSSKSGAFKLLSRGPQRLLSFVSRAARVKMTISGIPDLLIVV